MTITIPMWVMYGVTGVAVCAAITLMALGVAFLIFMKYFNVWKV